MYLWHPGMIAYSAAELRHNSTGTFTDGIFFAFVSLITSAQVVLVPTSLASHWVMPFPPQNDATLTTFPPFPPPHLPPSHKAVCLSASLFPLLGRRTTQTNSCDPAKWLLSRYWTLPSSDISMDPFLRLPLLGVRLHFTAVDPSDDSFPLLSTSAPLW